MSKEGFSFLSEINKFSKMNQKTRSLIKGIAVLVVLLAVLMELQFVLIPALSPYKLWLVVIAFAMVLFTTK